MSLSPCHQAMLVSTIGPTNRGWTIELKNLPSVCPYGLIAQPLGFEGIQSPMYEFAAAEATKPIGTSRAGDMASAR
eukprot:6219243-Prymnesium_polylepis.2